MPRNHARKQFVHLSDCPKVSWAPEENLALRNSACLHEFPLQIVAVVIPEFDLLMQQLKAEVVQGYNAAIIAYGQTASGKTYTMDGEAEGPGMGVIPRAISEIFAHIENDSAACSKYLVRAYYFQLYNEVISVYNNNPSHNPALVLLSSFVRMIFHQGVWCVSVMCDSLFPESNASQVHLLPRSHLLLL